MASKPKSNTYIVHHRGHTRDGGYTVLGRYKVGARNEKEAEDFLRKIVGKHTKVKVYYKDESSNIPHGTVIKECGINYN